MENKPVKTPKPMQPTERFTLQFNVQTREWDLVPASAHRSNHDSVPTTIPLLCYTEYNYV